MPANNPLEIVVFTLICTSNVRCHRIYGPAVADLASTSNRLSATWKTRKRTRHPNRPKRSAARSRRRKALLPPPKQPTRRSRRLAKVAELQESFLRAKAETENVRRRAQDDVSKAHKFAIESFAEHLLPVLDSLEAAVNDTSGDIAKVREGVELTLRQLTSALEKGRVVALNPVGEKFDPHQHRHFDGAGRPGAEHRRHRAAKGYMIADRVLRPALVTVAQPK